MEQRHFDGSFMKNKKYITHTYLAKRGYNIFFYRVLYEKVSSEIISVFG